MKKLIFLTVFCLLAITTLAQHGSNAYRDLADSLYRHHHYSIAADYYQKAIKNSKTPATVMLQVAKCYQKVNDLPQSEQWFAKAKKGGAVFSPEDTYQYARVLMTLQKRSEAEAVLTELLAKDPNALLVRRALMDVTHFEQYYEDSTRYEVVSLPINTPVSEFAPAFYKDGIVFSAAQQENFAKKKYHWDNSHYLNLYYSSRKDGQLQKPVLFEKQLNTRFHDGPAAFYDNYEKMIVNRNQPVKAVGKQDTWVWHLSLFDAQRSATEKSGWVVTPLPFDQPPYSAAHPAVSEDGNTLFFVSDKPGGYGGTDIYRSTRVKGVWTEPFNLGPTVNSIGNEVFPFFVNQTLYFASNGQGGLGGLDIFKSEYTVNGFAPPQNLGYPVNTTADDFSFITTGDQYTGYFASARNGNDDLFSFKKKVERVPALAKIFDGVTRQPLAGASVQLMTSSGEDITLTSDDNGTLRYALPMETAYMLVGGKDGKVGMATGLAVREEDESHMTHPMPAYGDTSRIACAGFIKNAEGIARQASVITIVDETTGKEIHQNGEPSVVSFLGEKGHTYRVVIKNDDGETTEHTLTLAADEKNAQSWTMVLKEKPSVMLMAARAFQASTQQPLGGADVKVITFSEPDVDLKTDANGLVEFSLQPGTAYMVIATKGNLTGMHSGMADPGTDKTSMIHPIPAQEAAPPPKPAVVLALVTDESGEVLKDAVVTITDKATGENVPVKMEDGVMSFDGERGKQYNINVSHDGHETTRQEIAIAPEGGEVEKISVVLKKIIPPPILMAARVFKASDQSPLAGASVKIMSFTEADQELVANESGVVEFTLPQGTPYMVVGQKDGFVGMHSGVADPGTDKASVIHPVPATDEPEKQLPVLAYLTNKDGDPVDGAVVTVTDKATGKKMQADVKDGLVSFVGIKGKDYSIVVTHNDHITVTKEVSVSADVSDVLKTTIVLEEKPAPPVPAAQQLPVTIQVTGKDGTTLKDAGVIVTEKTTGKIIEARTQDGVVTFTGEKGKDYVITASHALHETLSQQTTIPAQATQPTTVSLVMERNNVPAPALAAATATPVDMTLAVRVFNAADNSPLSGATVKIISFVKEDLELTANAEGIAEFMLPEGTTYMVVGSKGKFVGMHSGVAEKGMDKASIVHPVPAVVDPDTQLAVVGRITNRNSDVLADAVATVTEKASGEKVNVNVTDGLFSFMGEKGKEYSVTIAHKDHQTQTQRVALPELASGPGKVSFILEEKDMPPPPSMELAVRVFKATDKTPLAGAQVKVITFIAPDQELIADAEGIAAFTIPEDLAFMVVGSKDGYVGTYQGLSEKGADKNSVIHPVPASLKAETKTTVIARVVDEKGMPVANTQIEVSKKTTGEKVGFTAQDGIVNFAVDKGTEYVLKATVGDRVVETNIAVAQTAADVLTHELTLPKEKIATEQSETPVDMTLAVRVFNAGDNRPLSGATVKVISFVKEDLELTANAEGIAEFVLPEGTTYMVVGSKDKFVGMHSGVAEKGMDKASIVHPVPAVGDPGTQIAVVGRITNRNSDVLADAVATVTEKISGEQVNVKITDGLFSFVGEKGKEYSVTVEHKDHQTQTQRVALPELASGPGKVSFILEEKDMPASPSMELAVRVFKATDKTPLAGAQVKVITFIAPDQELIADAEGIAVFTIPEDLAFMVVGSKEGYVGTYQGLSEKGADKNSVIHPVPASLKAGTKTAVIARVVDEKGMPVANTKIEVSKKATGEKVEFTLQDGIVNIPVEKGAEYILKATAGDRVVESNIAVAQTAADVLTHEVTLPKAKTSADATTPLIVMHTDTGASKIYLNTGHAFAEITEQDGTLLLQDEAGQHTLGAGTLEKLQQEPAAYLSALGVKTDRTITLRNIYFDYNKAQLDDDDKQELANVKEVLTHYPSLKLVIQAHADDRGADSYNLNLSNRRANAVSAYLLAQGIGTGRMYTRGFGESMPVVPCATQNCSEEEYKRNRRAEFVLSNGPVKNGFQGAVYFSAKPKDNTSAYTRILKTYGTRTADGVTFKVSIGAYRYNSSLTFDELRGLGKVEVLQVDGITYYYLADFATLKEAEAARKKAVKRGVEDAGITIFKRDEKISLTDFIAMVE
jgi:outer membrane protein OmpA-like peptidoglycan-associated protein/myo-inositol-hexaphosphate 3-phosphohydrolase